MARCICIDEEDREECPPSCPVGRFNPCRSGCPTQDHKTYAECLKAANFGIARGESAPGQY